MKKTLFFENIHQTSLWSVVQIFVEHWGNNLQFYPDFALFSTLGRMNVDQDSFQVSKLSEDQKTRSSPVMEHYFQVLTSAQMHTRVKLLEGMQMKTILKLLERYIPPIPTWFRHHWLWWHYQLKTHFVKNFWWTPNVPNLVFPWLLVEELAS